MANPTAVVAERARRDLFGELGVSGRWRQRAPARSAEVQCRSYLLLQRLNSEKHDAHSTINIDAGSFGPNPSGETKFSGANGEDREMFIFSGLLTTSRIVNDTRSIHTLLNVMTIHTYVHTYIHTWLCAI